MRAKLYIPNPPIQSQIGKLTVSLEPLRNRRISGSTAPWLFFELKKIFQIIETVTSTRIEGNHTTVAEFVEAIREEDSEEEGGEEVHEIENVGKAIDYLEELQKENKLIIDKHLVLNLHHIVVDGLDPAKEGDNRPGAYRNAPRRITKSKHVLPPPSDVPDFMDEIYDFIKDETDPQLDLLKIAVVHHRFVWVHPFGNGNGRVVRLLTYAMLMKAGFIGSDGSRLLDPASIFGKNRNEYYNKLAVADDCSDEGLLKWAEYMLSGLLNEVGKIDRLLDENFTKKKIIMPALDYALDKQRINRLEYSMLKIALEQDIVKAADFAPLFPNVSRVNISLAIRKLRDQRLLRPMGKNSRTYNLRLNRNAITLGMILQLDKEGFLPEPIK